MVQNLSGLLRGKDIFVEGVGFIGKTGDIELPKIKFKQAEINGHSIDTGLLEPLEANVEVLELNDVLWDAVGKRINELATFVIKASSVSNSKETNIYVEIGAWVKEDSVEMNNLAEKVGVKLTLNVQTYRLEIDGKEHYGIDLPNYICKINGKDHYETLRKHIM